VAAATRTTAASTIIEPQVSPFILHPWLAIYG
jgi:hypothetical protein